MFRRVAAVALVDFSLKTGQPLFLASERAVDGLWTFPGGGVEAGEFPWITAVRETRAETGVRVRLDHLIRPQHPTEFEYNGDKYKFWLYLALLGAGTSEKFWAREEKKHVGWELVTFSFLKKVAGRGLFPQALLPVVLQPGWRDLIEEVADDLICTQIVPREYTSGNITTHLLMGCRRIELMKKLW